MWQIHAQMAMDLARERADGGAEQRAGDARPTAGSRREAAAQPARTTEPPAAGDGRGAFARHRACWLDGDAALRRRHAGRPPDGVTSVPEVCDA